MVNFRTDKMKSKSLVFRNANELFLYVKHRVASIAITPTQFY